MPLAFVILLIFSVVSIWFLLSPLYRKIGNFIKEIYLDAKKEIEKKDDEEKENY